MAFCALPFFEQLLAACETLWRGLHLGIDPTPIHLIEPSEVLSDCCDLVFGEMECGHAGVHPPARLDRARILEERPQEFRLSLLTLGVQVRRPLQVAGVSLEDCSNVATKT